MTDPYGPFGERVHLEERRHRDRHRAVRHARRRTCDKDVFTADRGRDRARDAGRHRRRVRRCGHRLRRPATVGQRRPHRPARRGRDPALRVRLGGRDGPSRSSPRSSVSASASRSCTSSRRSPTSAPSRPSLATMIGLGVGIDYSLFIVTRYRENLAAGHGRRSRGRPLRRDGRVRGALRRHHRRDRHLRAPRVAGIPYVARLGYMAGIVVAVMMLAALTLLPAIIGVVGHGIDRWKVPSLDPPPRPRRCGRQRPGTSRPARLGALGHARRPPRVAVRHLRRGDPPRDRVAGALDAPRRVRRRQPADVHDAAAGLRPGRGGLRSRHQRAAARRGPAPVRRATTRC